MDIEDLGQWTHDRRSHYDVVIIGAGVIGW
jgi:cation diffusion facilitator CzcD-associated flavoprotein CzcO